MKTAGVIERLVLKGEKSAGVMEGLVLKREKTAGKASGKKVKFNVRKVDVDVGLQTAESSSSFN